MTSAFYTDLGLQLAVCYSALSYLVPSADSVIVIQATFSLPNIPELKHPFRGCRVRVGIPKPAQHSNRDSDSRAGGTDLCSNFYGTIPQCAKS